MTGSPINHDLARAVDLGLMFYEGRPHKLCGETLRYASGAGCVRCAKRRSLEQRERQKFLKLNPVQSTRDLSEEDRADVFAADEPDPVDIEPDDGLDVDDPDDAQARAEAGIDELM